MAASTKKPRPVWESFLLGFVVASLLCSVVSIVNHGALSSRIFMSSRLSSQPIIWLVGDQGIAFSGYQYGDRSRGFGEYLQQYFSWPVRNRGISSRSARTYATKGDWERVSHHLSPNDFVVIGFGNNDDGPPELDRNNRTSIMRDNLIDTIVGFNGETVYTFHKYMTDMINDARSKGAIPILSTGIAFNVWPEDENHRRLTLWPGPDIASRYAMAQISDHTNTSLIRHRDATEHWLRSLGYEAAMPISEDIHNDAAYSAEGAQKAAALWVEELACTTGQGADILKSQALNKKGRQTVQNSKCQSR